MRFRLKPAHLGIILILLIFGSMVPFIAPRKAITLPSQNIIDYRLTPEQEDYAVRLGKTVIGFEYDAGCEFCVNSLRFLERIAAQEKGQIILQEIPGYLQNSTKLRAISYYGEEILRNPGENETWDVLCVLMVDPPLFCALRGI